VAVVPQTRSDSNGPSLLPVTRRTLPPREAVATVPRLCDGQTVVCLASGPSLTADDVAACYDRAAAVAVNDSYRLAPWAVALMASDAKWWRYHAADLADFRGRRYCLEDKGGLPPDVELLRNTGREGLEHDQTGLRTGGNSGYAAINLAVHLGAARIVLLGYDMGPTPAGRVHWFGAHPRALQRSPSPFQAFRERFRTLVDPLAALGVEVVNASRQTTLTVFPRMSLDEALR